MLKAFPIALFPDTKNSETLLYFLFQMNRWNLRLEKEAESIKALEVRTLLSLCAEFESMEASWNTLYFWQRWKLKKINQALVMQKKAFVNALMVSLQKAEGFYQNTLKQFENEASRSTLLTKKIGKSGDLDLYPSLFKEAQLLPVLLEQFLKWFPKGFNYLQKMQCLNLRGGRLKRSPFGLCFELDDVPPSSSFLNHFKFRWFPGLFKGSVMRTQWWHRDSFIRLSVWFDSGRAMVPERGKKLLPFCEGQWSLFKKDLGREKKHLASCKKNLEASFGSHFFQRHTWQFLKDYGHKLSEIEREFKENQLLFLNDWFFNVALKRGEGVTDEAKASFYNEFQEEIRAYPKYQDLWISLQDRAHFKVAKRKSEEEPFPTHADLTAPSIGNACHSFNEPPFRSPKEVVLGLLQGVTAHDKEIESLGLVFKKVHQQAPFLAPFELAKKRSQLVQKAFEVLVSLIQHPFFSASMESSHKPKALATLRCFANLILTIGEQAEPQKLVAYMALVFIDIVALQVENNHRWRLLCPEIEIFEALLLKIAPFYQERIASFRHYRKEAFRMETESGNKWLSRLAKTHLSALYQELCQESEGLALPPWFNSRLKQYQPSEAGFFKDFPQTVLLSPPAFFLPPVSSPETGYAP